MTRSWHEGAWLNGRIFRSLASLNLALVLLGALVVTVVIGGTLPQLDRLSPADLNEWQNDWPWLSVWLDKFGLFGVFGSNGFLALSILLVVNLSAGMVSYCIRILSWLRGETRPMYRLSGNGAAPTFSIGAMSLSEKGGESQVVASGTLGLFGMPIFHVGIVLIVLAGMLNASQRFGAHFELAEEEILSEARGKLEVDRKVSDAPIDLGFRLRLDSVHVKVDDGNLKELNAKIALQDSEGGFRRETLTVNNPLRIGRYRLYLDSTMGQAAAFERIMPDGQMRTLLINFNVPLSGWERPVDMEREETVVLGPRPMHFRMVLSPGDQPRFHLVATRSGQPIFDGALRPGGAADLGTYRLVFLGVAPWAGFYLASDGSVVWVFAGFVIALTGFLLHLLFFPRRVKVRRGEAGWSLEGWATRDDWRFLECWRRVEVANGSTAGAT